MAGIPNDWTTEQQNERLKEWKDAGVHVIRTGIAPNDKGIDIAKLIYDHGVKIDWMPRFQYRPDAPKRPYRKEFPNMWSAPPLSALDPDGFRAYFQSNLDKLEAKGVRLAAFEIGNEINWAAFNGDFPVPGQGKIFGLDDLSRDPEAQQIAKGFLQYLKILAVVKDVRDHSKLNQHTPVISSGLAMEDLPPGPSPNSTADAVSSNVTIQFLRAHGLDDLVDAYGIHTYPSDKGPGQPAAAEVRQKRLKNVLAECRPVGSSDGKPCWVTEWGFKNKDTSCPPQEVNQVKLVEEMKDNFRLYVRQKKLLGLLYYAWTDDRENFGVFRCGSLTQTGRLAIAPM